MSGASPLPRRRDKVLRPFKRSHESSSSSVKQSVSQSAPQVPLQPHDQQGQRFFQKTLSTLDPEVRATIKELGYRDITSAVNGALAAAKDKKQICEAKRWTCTILGRQVRLRDLVEKTIVWLDRFKAAGDVAVNADPVHAGLPWAVIRLMLEARQHCYYYCT